MCDSQMCLLWRGTGWGGLAHHLEPKPGSSQRSSSSEPLGTPGASMGKQPGGLMGFPLLPARGHTEGISAVEPEMSYLSALCGVHNHYHHHHRDKAPRYETGKRWSEKHKGIDVFIPITATEAECGRQGTRSHWGGEKEQPGPTEGGEVTALQRSCIPCLGTCRQCRHPVTS